VLRAGLFHRAVRKGLNDEVFLGGSLEDRPVRCFRQRRPDLEVPGSGNPKGGTAAQGRPVLCHCALERRAQGLLPLSEWTKRRHQPLVARVRGFNVPALLVRRERVQPPDDCRCVSCRHREIRMGTSQFGARIRQPHFVLVVRVFSPRAELFTYDQQKPRDIGDGWGDSAGM